MKRVLQVLALLLVLGIVGLTAAAATFRSALAPPGGTGDAIDVEVRSGATLKRVARDLADAGAVRNATAFEWWTRWRGLGAQLRAGEYRLSRSLDADGVLAQIVAGKVRTHPVVIPEGLTAVEIADRIDAVGLASRADFLATVRDPAFAAELGVEGDDLEGYLFPETYHIARGLGARAVARTLVEHFLAAWQEIEPGARERGLSMRETVTLASIIEKETGAAEERPLIAAVFHNRLRLGMRLETDPTVIYGIPDFDGNLTRAHLQDASNKYNTYRIRGLRPGPIANPGAASLRAAVDPADAGYLFFVSRNDGTHVFSRTYREHSANVDRFQRRRSRRR